MHLEKNDVTSNKVTPRKVVNYINLNRAALGLFGLVGLVLAAIYLWSIQSIYEARWQMSMAQYIVVANNGSNSANSEDPASLVQRLKFKTTYPADVFEECGQNRGEGDYLNKALSAQTVKGVPNLVEFKFKASSVDSVRRCSDLIVSMIIEQQAAMIVERQAGKTEQLVKFQEELNQELKQLNRLKRGEFGNFYYLAKQDKLSWLRTRIAGLQDELDFAQKFPAKLNAPVFISNKPIATNAPMILFMGGILGVLIGMLYVRLREDNLDTKRSE